MLMRLGLAAGLVFTASILVAARTEGASDPQTNQITGAVERYVKVHYVSMGPWDEQTTPLLQVEDISRQSRNVRIVRACQFQPTILVAGERVEATVTKVHGDWRVTSFGHMGGCKPNIGGAVEASHSSEIQH